MYGNAVSANGSKMLVLKSMGYLLLLVLITAPFAAAQNKVFKGEITDEHLNCMKTPMKATAGIDDRHECVLYWAHFVQPPSKFVLYDAPAKKTYQLNDQWFGQLYAGRMVEIKGTLDSETNTITVKDIKPL
jgi:hypothetical protein